jgi:hypothetical protein
MSDWRRQGTVNARGAHALNASSRPCDRAGSVCLILPAQDSRSWPPRDRRSSFLAAARISAHRITKVSPPINSNTKTNAFTMMITIVTTGKRLGRRDASDSGIMLPTLSSFVSRDKPPPQQIASIDLFVVHSSAPDSPSSIFRSATLLHGRYSTVGKCSFGFSDCHRPEILGSD